MKDEFAKDLLGRRHRHGAVKAMGKRHKGRRRREEDEMIRSDGKARRR
jgi:hypothetical protein